MLQSLDREHSSSVMLWRNAGLRWVTSDKARAPLKRTTLELRPNGVSLAQRRRSAARR